MELSGQLNAPAALHLVGDVCGLLDCGVMQWCAVVLVRH
jgi:hypothetical protein